MRLVVARTGHVRKVSCDGLDLIEEHVSNLAVALNYKKRILNRLGSYDIFVERMVNLILTDAAIDTHFFPLYTTAIKSYESNEL